MHMVVFYLFQALTSETCELLRSVRLAWPSEQGGLQLDVLGSFFFFHLFASFLFFFWGGGRMRERPVASHAAKRHAQFSLRRSRTIATPKAALVKRLSPMFLYRSLDGCVSKWGSCKFVGFALICGSRSKGPCEELSIWRPSELVEIPPPKIRAGVAQVCFCFAKVLCSVAVCVEKWATVICVLPRLSPSRDRGI